MKAIAYNSRGDSFDVSARVLDHPTPYGNGKLLEVKVNSDNILTVIDCRYIPDFHPLEVFKNVLNDYFTVFKIVDEHDWRIVKLVARCK